MKIRLENLAHIKDAELEDRQLVILTGDNGTGKTLLLETFSYIKECYRDYIDDFVSELSKDDHKINLVTDWKKIDLKARLDQLDMVNEIKEAEERYIDDQEILMTVSYVDAMNDHIVAILDNKKKEVKRKVTEEILMKKSNTESNFDYNFLNYPKFERESKLSFRLKISVVDYALMIMVYSDDQFYASKLPLIDTVHLRSTEEQDEFDLNEPTFLPEEHLIKQIEEEIKRMYLEFGFKRFFGSGDTLYLPSERNLLIDHVLTRSADATENKIRQRYSEKLFNSAYLRFMSFSENYSEYLKEKWLNNETSLYKLLGGSVIVEGDGEISSLKTNDGTIIKRELFSTKQNRLFPFLMLETLPFRSYHEAIIEEPEAHLSIKSMKDLLEYIMQFFIKGKNKKDQVFLSTHSDVFFAFLNNMLIENEQIDVVVYELIANADQTTRLVEKERTEYGYQVKLFNELLDELYEETIQIQKMKEAD